VTRYKIQLSDVVQLLLKHAWNVADAKPSASERSLVRDVWPVTWNVFSLNFVGEEGSEYGPPF
jgi:hypothetical protein